MRFLNLSPCLVCGIARWRIYFKQIPFDSSQTCRRCAPYVDGGPGWLVRSPLWLELAPFMVVEDHATAEGELYPRFRLEVEPPIALFLRLRKLLVRCVHCGSSVHPFRRRLQERGPRLYYTSTCPVTLRVGCSRSHAAHADHRAVLDELGGEPKASERQSSFGWE